MFFTTYKTTFKRIFRAPIFWMALLIVVVLVCVDTYKGSYGGGEYSRDPVTGETVMEAHEGDRDPRFVQGYHKYHESIGHRMRYMMFYAVPVLCVITVMCVISGDYSDNFFEIERAGGVRSSAYFFGRLAAILTLLYSITLILSLFSYNYYFFSRGGIANLTKQTWPDVHKFDWPFTTLKEYLLDSTKVIVRMSLGAQLPAILLFTSVTYAIGAYFESGLLSGIGGSVSAVVAFLALQRYSWAYDSVVYKYFLPAKVGPYKYLSCYDTMLAGEEFYNDINIGLMGMSGNPYLCDSLEAVIAWIATMVGISAVCIAISYICTRRRKI